MSNAKEIRTKIKSIQNTQKITRAMEMVAASKMRKAQERMYETRPYAKHIGEIVRHVAKSKSEYQHPFLIKRHQVKRVGIIVISTDKGLCGGLNINLFKQVVKEMKSWHREGKEVDLCLIGSKASGFFSRAGANVVAQIDSLGDAPKIGELIGAIKVMLDGYLSEKLDEIYVFSNDFLNTMTQKPIMSQLLPILPSSDHQLDYHWDYIYEPQAEVIINQLFKRYMEMSVYQAVIENLACEQAARMVAMKSASDNAGDLISEFQLIYNKARQAAITQELSEIVAGAAAV